MSLVRLNNQHGRNLASAASARGGGRTSVSCKRLEEEWERSRESACLVHTDIFALGAFGFSRCHITDQLALFKFVDMFAPPNHAIYFIMKEILHTWAHLRVPTNSTTGRDRTRSEKLIVTVNDGISPENAVEFQPISGLPPGPRNPLDLRSFIGGLFHRSITVQGTNVAVSSQRNYADITTDPETTLAELYHTLQEQNRLARSRRDDNNDDDDDDDSEDDDDADLTKTTYRDLQDYREKTRRRQERDEDEFAYHIVFDGHRRYRDKLPNTTTAKHCKTKERGKRTNGRRNDDDDNTTADGTGHGGGHNDDEDDDRSTNSSESDGGGASAMNAEDRDRLRMPPPKPLPPGKLPPTPNSLVKKRHCTWKKRNISDIALQLKRNPYRLYGTSDAAISSRYVALQEIERAFYDGCELLSKAVVCTDYADSDPEDYDEHGMIGRVGRHGGGSATSAASNRFARELENRSMDALVGAVPCRAADSVALTTATSSPYAAAAVLKMVHINYEVRSNNVQEIAGSKYSMTAAHLLFEADHDDPSAAGYTMVTNPRLRRYVARTDHAEETEEQALYDVTFDLQTEHLNRVTWLPSELLAGARELRSRVNQLRRTIDRIPDLNYTRRTGGDGDGDSATAPRRRAGYRSTILPRVEDLLADVASDGAIEAHADQEATTVTAGHVDALDRAFDTETTDRQRMQKLARLTYTDTEFKLVNDRLFTLPKLNELTEHVIALAQCPMIKPANFVIHNEFDAWRLFNAVLDYGLECCERHHTDNMSADTTIGYPVKEALSDFVLLANKRFDLIANDADDPFGLRHYRLLWLHAPGSRIGDITTFAQTFRRVLRLLVSTSCCYFMNRKYSFSTRSVIERHDCCFPKAVQGVYASLFLRLRGGHQLLCCDPIGTPQEAVAWLHGYATLNDHLWRKRRLPTSRKLAEHLRRLTEFPRYNADAATTGADMFGDGGTRRGYNGDDGAYFDASTAFDANETTMTSSASVAMMDEPRRQPLLDRVTPKGGAVEYDDPDHRSTYSFYTSSSAVADGDRSTVPTATRRANGTTGRAPRRRTVRAAVDGAGGGTVAKRRRQPATATEVGVVDNEDTMMSMAFSNSTQH